MFSSPPRPVRVTMGTAGGNGVTAAARMTVTGRGQGGR
jgi:hypothetical protein